MSRLLKDTSITEYLRIELEKKVGDRKDSLTTYLGLIQIIQNLHERVMDLEEETGLD